MNALILAGGYGKRLGKITKNIPKCLLEINGQPLLDMWVKKLINSGIKNIYINTHYKSEKVEKFVKLKNYKSNIKLLNEKKLLGTAGTLRKNFNKLKNSDLMFIHCDNYSEEDLNILIKKHRNRPRKSKVTMMTFTSSNPKSCGIIKTNRSKIITRYEEKPDKPFSNLANSAIMIISKNYLKKIYKILNLNKNLNDFCNDIIPIIYKDIYTYKTLKPLIDIGTEETLNKAIKINLKNK